MAGDVGIVTYVTVTAGTAVGSCDDKINTISDQENGKVTVPITRVVMDVTGVQCILVKV